MLTGQDVAGNAPTQWMVTMSSLLVVGLLAAGMRGSLYRRVDQLSERASRDELTGLLNRGSLYERFAVERARALRDEGVVSVLAIDVDEFKALNDTLGHPTGDQALRQVAAALQHWTRDDRRRRPGSEATSSRSSSPATQPADALGIAKDLCAAIARSPCRRTSGSRSASAPPPATSPCPPSASSGRPPTRPMYEAKRSGGDRVRFRGSIDGPAPEAHPPSEVEAASH